MQNRLDPKLRKAQILDAALAVAGVQGTDRITFKDVAAVSNTSIGLVIHYFGTMTALRRAVMRAAVKREDVAIVARGLATRDPHAAKAGPELRAAAAALLSQQAVG